LGDTSSEIQVPSEVVKSTLRVGLRGSESAFCLVVSARWAARHSTGTAAARSVAVNDLGITGLRGEERRHAGKA